MYLLSELQLSPNRDLNRHKCNETIENKQSIGYMIEGITFYILDKLINLP